MDEMTCPACKGEKIVFAHINTGERKTTGFRHVPCWTCKATGTVDAEYPRRKAQGKALANVRRAQRRSLRDAAARLNVSPMTLSGWEHGREPIPEGMLEKIQELD